MMTMMMIVRRWSGGGRRSLGIALLLGALCIAIVLPIAAVADVLAILIGRPCKRCRAQQLRLGWCLFAVLMALMALALARACVRNATMQLHDVQPPAQWSVLVDVQLVLTTSMLSSMVQLVRAWAVAAAATAVASANFVAFFAAHPFLGISLFAIWTVRVNISL